MLNQSLEKSLDEKIYDQRHILPQVTQYQS
jgi:hypothetical protein